MITRITHHFNYILSNVLFYIKCYFFQKTNFVYRYNNISSYIKNILFAIKILNLNRYYYIHYTKPNKNLFTYIKHYRIISTISLQLLLQPIPLLEYVQVILLTFLEYLYSALHFQLFDLAP